MYAQNLTRVGLQLGKRMWEQTPTPQPKPFLLLGHLCGGTGFIESLCSLCPQRFLGFNWTACSDLTSDPDWSKKLN